jgi:type VI secretion system secreted protein Hcp
MAIGDMFLLVEGKQTGMVKGESSDSVYPGQIQVFGWTWGMNSSSSMGGSGAGLKTSLSELRVVKSADRASTPLMSIMRNGEVIKKAVLTVRKAGGVQIDYFKVTIEGGRITNYEIGSQSGPELSEHFSIAFEKIEVQYFEQDEKGQRRGGTSFSAQVLS